MSKNLGLKGGTLEDSPRLGGWVTHQRAAGLPEDQAKAYLWLAKHGPATVDQVWDAGMAEGVSCLGTHVVYENKRVRVRA